MKSPEYAFHLIEILAGGSYGTVRVAEPFGRSRKVVIKVLQPELLEQPDILARTRDEARLLERLYHPNIVAVEDLFEHHGRPVMVMEHIEGLELDTLLQRYEQGLPGPSALEIVRQVATALDAARGAQRTSSARPLRVVHRDIRPSNVIVSVDGGVKVVDFGMARADFDGREANTDVLVYSVMAYMSPERFEGLPAHPSMDIYALGLLTAAALSGRVPMLPRSSSRPDRAIHTQLLKMEPADLAPPLVDDVQRLLRALCSHDPESRPVAGEAAESLRALVERCDHAADLGALGHEIAALRDAREHVAPRAHASWRDVSFLDEASQVGEPPRPAEASPAGPSGPLQRLWDLLMGQR